MAERLVFLKRKRVSSTQMPPSTLTMKRTRMYVGVMMLALTKPSMNHAWDAARCQYHGRVLFQHNEVAGPTYEHANGRYQSDQLADSPADEEEAGEHLGRCALRPLLARRERLRYKKLLRSCDMKPDATGRSKQSDACEREAALLALLAVSSTEYARQLNRSTMRVPGRSLCVRSI